MESTKSIKHAAATLLLIFAAIAATAQTYVRKTDLPTLYINTYGGVGVTSKNTFVYATAFLVDTADVTTRYDSLRIRGRGNSTWNMAKKPYRIKLNEKARLLGPDHAKAKNWTLMANAADKTMIRNALASAVGEFLGLKFNPSCLFVDLTLNGTYLGTYQISDQIEVKKKRVEVAEQNVPLLDGDDISGGYLLELDRSYDFWNKGTKLDGFYTSVNSLPVRIRYPKDDEIVQSQHDYISAFVNQFESRLMSDDFRDSTLGYRPLVDSASLAAWYVATEVNANVDGFYSTLFYKERGDDHLYWGPLWDNDISFNNDNRTDRASSNNTTEQMMADVAYNGSKQWVNRMWQDPWFAALVNRALQSALDAGLTDYMLAAIDSLQGVIGQSQRLNYQKWGISTRMYHEMVLYTTYDDYVNDLRDFVMAHNQWLPQAFAQRIPAPDPGKFIPRTYFYRIVNKGTGKPIEGSSVVYEYDSIDGRKRQMWALVPVGEYYMIVNRESGQAMRDPSDASTYSTQIQLADASRSDTTQLWTLKQQGSYFNLINLANSHAINLSGGNSANYTRVISWKNDERNSTSANRLFSLNITPDSITEPRFTAVERISESDYALVFNRQEATLRFAADDASGLGFTASVYTASGELVGTFRAGETFSLEAMPAGVYVVRWTSRSGAHSRKFAK